MGTFGFLCAETGLDRIDAAASFRASFIGAGVTVVVDLCGDCDGDGGPDTPGDEVSGSASVTAIHSKGSVTRSGTSGNRMFLRQLFSLRYRMLRTNAETAPAGLYQCEARGNTAHFLWS